MLDLKVPVYMQMNSPARIASVVKSPGSPSVLPASGPRSIRTVDGAMYSPPRRVGSDESNA
eukprot:scaffold141204_cov160-Phaeocystis_antarctica.AAC.1